MHKSLQFVREVRLVRLPMGSVLLFDVQRKGGRRHQPITAAARHHGNTASAVSVEVGATAGAARGCGCGRGGGRLLKLLLVDFALFGPAILEPNLHLEMKNKRFYLSRSVELLSFPLKCRCGCWLVLTAPYLSL